MTAQGLPAAALNEVDRTDRLIGLGALAILLAALTAIARGHTEWSTLPVAVWVHLIAALVALALTPVMLWCQRGDLRHRLLGYVWVSAMTVTATASFAVRGINHGNLSLIHILSGWTLINLPFVVIFARRRDIARHRSALRGMIIGALLIAGAFTFTFGRLLAHWLYG